MNLALVPVELVNVILPLASIARFADDARPSCVAPAQPFMRRPNPVISCRLKVLNDPICTPAELLQRRKHGSVCEETSFIELYLYGNLKLAVLALIGAHAITAPPLKPGQMFGKRSPWA
jgi:hypothetical protein